MKKTGVRKMLIGLMRRWRLQERLLMSFVLFAILPAVIIGSVTFISSYNESRARAVDYSKNMVAQMSSNVKSVYDDAVSRFHVLIYSATIQGKLVQYQNLQDSGDKNQVSQAIKSTLVETIGNNSNIDSVEILTVDGDSFGCYGFGVTGTDKSGSRLLAMAGERGGMFIQIQKKELNYNDEYYLVIGKQLKLTGRYGESGDDAGQAQNSLFERNDPIGYAFMSVKMDGIHRLNEHTGMDGSGYFVVTDSNGRIISHPDMELLTTAYDPEIISRVKREAELSRGEYTSYVDSGLLARVPGYFQTQIDGDEKIITYDMIPVSGWIVMNISSVAEIMQSTRQNGLVTILVACLSLVLAIMIATVVTRSVAEPVRELLGAMDEAGEGNLKVRVEEAKGSRDEVSKLSERFNDMVRQIRRLIDVVYKTRLKESKLEFLHKEAELNALQQQINPHFLYNTLESILWTAEENEDLETAEMVSALGAFFRTSIQTGEAFVSVEDEIQNVQNYIYLQKIRFLDRFRVEWDIDDDVLHCRTVKLVLQPVVENAIVHGVERIPGGGVITISGRKKGGDIRLCVRDNGRGMSADKLNEVREMMQSGNLDTAGSIGLRNVNQRIKLYFGKEYGLSISSAPGEGTVVTISFTTAANGERYGVEGIERGEGKSHKTVNS